MELILISKRRSAHGRVHLGRFSVSALLVGLISLGGLITYGGLRFGPLEPPSRPDVAAVVWQERVDVQRREVGEAIKSAEDNLQAMAQRLGEMHAEVMRLDALGERLVELSKLDPKEFDFAARPPLGGPEVSSQVSMPEVPDFLKALEAVATQLDELSLKLGGLESVLLGRRDAEQVEPVGRPVNSGWISSFYGYRIDPITGKRAFHEGVDFAGRTNSDVVAVASGVVTWSGYRHGYGKMVEVDHGNGYATRYAHNNKNLVKVGDIVKQRQPIALMGSSGRSTGPHVHFEVLLEKKPVNPIKFVRRSG